MERVDANLIPFAKNNPSGYRFAFGTDTATDDINVNYNDNIKKGWGTTPNEFPEVEDFNAMAYTTSYLIAYLYQMGIAEWNNKQNYRQYSRVIGSDGKIYKAKTGTDLAPNVNKNPTTDSTNWEIDAQFDINTFENKSTPVNTDNLAIQEVGGLFKKVTLANLKTFISPASSETVAGIIELATSAEAQAGTDDLRAVTPLKLFNSLKGSNQSLSGNGYQKLHGGLIIQWGTVLASSTSGGYTAAFYPIRFPNNCLQVVGGRDALGEKAVMLVGKAGGDPSGQVIVQNWGASAEIAKYVAIGY